ncbi:MAG: FadR family transcriptional regulator [Verrucomicrobia bacterium]|nr:FadR family transcriptional regulator [Verrucomicrobiota bacterium]
MIEKVCADLTKRIQEAIRKGQVWLPTERELAVKLGVSRTVLREATKRLESQGLLQIEHGRGLRVVDHLHNPLTKSISLRLPDRLTRLEQLAEVRLFLEPEIARLAALRLKPEDLAALKANQEGLRKATTTEEAVTFDAGFHQVLVRSAGNQILRLLLEALADSSRESRIATGPCFGDEGAHMQHEKIVAALERRDADGSAEAMREHIHHVLRDLEQLRRMQAVG